MAALPDMIPVTIRSATVPELISVLQYKPLEKVLAGVLLTWEEFLHLFEIKLNPSYQYAVRGTSGVTFDLNSKVADFLSSFKKKLKIYPVSIERAGSDSDNTVEGEGHSAMTVSRNVFEANLSEAVVNDKVNACHTPKKLKLLDEDKRKRNTRLGKESLNSIQKIAHNVLQSQPSNIKRKTLKRNGTRRSSMKSRSPSPRGNKSERASIPVDQLSKLQLGVSGQKLKRHSTSTERRLSIDAATSTSSVKRGRMQKSGSSSRRDTNEMDESENSSESGDEEMTSRHDKKILKTHVVDYLNDKVSPRSFLRLRQELASLREHEKYFKVTSVVPMAAGMMEQMFCRKFAE